VAVLRFAPKDGRCLRVMVKHRSLQGQLLAAHPKRSNLYLSRAVVLVVEHSVLGAWGLQINFQHSRVENLGQILENQGLVSGLDVPVYFGGQYHHNRCFILHSSDWSCETTMKVTEDLYISADMYILSALAEGDGPKLIRPIVGLHQWRRGELDMEISEDIDHGWLQCDSTVSMVFDLEGDEQWQQVLDHATRNRVNELWS